MNEKQPTALSLRLACSAAADDLAATRQLAAALDAENAALRSRLDTEKAAARLLQELNTTRAAEANSLREALAAKNQAITAKDRLIEADEKLIADLKRHRMTIWRRIGDILLGAGVAAIVK